MSDPKISDNPVRDAMLKEVTPTNQTITNASMTGTAVVTSVVSNITYKDSVAIQLQWSGSPVGTFEIQGCLDYKPALAQSDGLGAPNNGTWIPIAITNPVTGVTSTTQSTGLGSPILINMNQIAFPWLRVQYTNASGSGTLNCYLSAKSLG